MKQTQQEDDWDEIKAQYKSLVPWLKAVAVVGTLALLIRSGTYLLLTFLLAMAAVMGPFYLWYRFLRHWNGGLRHLEALPPEQWGRQRTWLFWSNAALGALWTFGIWLLSTLLQTKLLLVAIPSGWMLVFIYWMAAWRRDLLGLLAREMSRWIGLGLILAGVSGLAVMSLAISYRLFLPHDLVDATRSLLWLLPPLVAALPPVIGALMSWGWIRREARYAQEGLDAGAQLCVFSEPGLWERALSRRQLRPWLSELLGSGDSRKAGRNQRQVVASYALFHYRQIIPRADSDRRLVLLLDAGKVTLPRRCQAELEALCRMGWRVYAVGEEGSDRSLEPLLNAVGVTVYTGDRAQQRQWVKNRLRPESHERVLGILSALQKEIPPEPRTDFLRTALCALENDYDETECFYQLLKVLEYIIHYRALWRCAQADGDAAFPNAPSFGTMEQLQCNWYGAEQAVESPALQQAIGTLVTAGNVQNKDLSWYARLGASLTAIYNSYVGHGTLAYRVTPELTLALAVVSDCVVRDFLTQSERLGPQASVPVQLPGGKRKDQTLQSPAWQCREDGCSLLSYLSEDGQGGYWVEYLDYATGELRYSDQRKWITFQADYGIREGATT